MRKLIFLFLTFLFLILFAASCEVIDEEPVFSDDLAFEFDAGDELDSLLPEPEPCYYPESSNSLLYSETFPEVSWLEAFDGDRNELTIHLSDQYCGTSEENGIPHYDSIVLAIGTGWCPYCPDNMRYVDSLSEDLEENNAMIIYTELQTEFQTFASSEYAYDYINNLGITSGYRVGDADSWPFENFLSNSSDIISYPTGFVIRTRDMKIIANQRDSAYYLDFRSITAGISED